MELQPMSVDELPAHSDWPARLLGLTAESEEWGGTGTEPYERQFRELLELHRDNPDWTVHDLLREIKRHARDDPSPVSRDGDLYTASREAIQDLQDNALLAAVEPALDGDELVVVLGCGFGADLGVLAEAYPDCAFVGGEPTASGRALADRLFANDEHIAIERFDFRDEAWEPLERNSERDVVMVTRESLSTLASSRDAVGRLAGYAGEVVAGVHLEYVDELHSTESMLGLLRRAYTRERGYDRDLLSSLRAVDGVRIEAPTYDVVGANPLHPLSVVRWRPAERCR